MSVEVKISATDMANFKRSAEMFFKRKKQAVLMALDAVALDIESEAKLIVPLDTGVLRSSIRVTNPNTKDLFRIVKAERVYARYIEMGKPVGTGPHGGPKPYLRPALKKGKKAFPKYVKKAFKLR